MDKRFLSYARLWGCTPFFYTTSRRTTPVDSGSTDNATEIPVADVRALRLEEGRRIITRHAGIYLFLPLLAQLQFDDLVTGANYPGTKMIPAANALLSLLTLKLLDKERLSHIDDFNCDEALGMFDEAKLLACAAYADLNPIRGRRKGTQRTQLNSIADSAKQGRGKGGLRCLEKRCGLLGLEGWLRGAAGWPNYHCKHQCTNFRR